MERLVRDWEELKRLSLMSAHQLHQLPLSTPGPLPLRSLRWRLHLDLLPAENFGGDESETSRIWIAASRKERLNYENLRNQFLIDPSTLQDTSHPLSLEEDSPWARYHADQDLRTTIMLDVSRTFPEDKYFRQTRVQRCLGDVLFVYAKMHAAMGYRQGMHELLAPLLLAVDVDAVDAVGGNAFFLAEVLDRRFVEHDAFALFDRLMRLCAPWYAAAGPSALVSRCRQMFDRLSAVDSQLAEHIGALDIEPQLFGLRWFRLLYGREIAGLHSLLLLWDALLADAQGPLQLVDWVGIVMVLANRRELIASDYADCLATLLHLPPLPRPVPETLERTPVLPNTPLPAGSREEMGRGAQRLPLAALAMPDMAPVQRLALQAAYLRSRPVAESAQAVAAQYALWESESWAVVEGGHEAAEPVVAVIDSELPQPQPSASPQPKPKSPASGSRSARKTYTIGTLQQRRTAGGSGSGSGASTAYSPPAAAPSFVPSPVEGLRSPNEVMCSLGSLTAQIACLAAQCADLLALRHDGRAVRGVAAGLHTLSRVWQDEIARSPGALDVRPQALSDADLRVVLRDLDSLHAELTQRM